MEVLIASAQQLKKYLNDEKVEKYVKGGGILRLKIEKDSVKIIYPSKQQIKERLSEIREELRRIKREKEKVSSLNKGSVSLDTLYLRHLLLRMVDRDYKDITDSLDVKKLLDDKRGRKILEQLQKDREYRERLREAIENSPVYKKSSVGSFIDETRRVKSTLITNKLKLLEKVEKQLKEEEDLLKHLLRYT